MRKSITSFLMLFVCLQFTWAADLTDALTFNFPAYWEYNSSADGYPFAIVNDGNDFEGEIALFAKDANGNIFELFTQNVFIGANSTFEQEYYFTNEIGLEPATYTFFFKYGKGDGEMKEVLGKGTGIIRAPSSVTRIPITTTTDPGKLTLSSNRLRSGSQLSVYSTVELNEVNVVNMAGQVVRAQRTNLEKEVIVDVDGLNEGKYIVVGKTKEGVLSAKMLKVGE
ncbi:MAG: T9SS type A sorting domain-containing protein [Bacteroidales bacterium]